jgi:hypothetical protein
MLILWEGISFRTYNEPFMHEVKRWLLYITRLLKKHKLFYPQGGPIILVQLENEYDLVSNIHQSMGQQYLQWYSDLYRGIQDLYILRALFNRKFRVIHGCTSNHVQKQS